MAAKKEKPIPTATVSVGHTVKITTPTKLAISLNSLEGFAAQARAQGAPDEARVSVVAAKFTSWSERPELRGVEISW